MGPKSDTLFHFTKSIEFLKGIVLNGFLPRYSLEDNRHLEIDYIAYPMTCFCDIPISRISEHTAFYGEYGIGMTKEWGLKNGLNPLIYTPPTSPTTRLANFLLSLNKKNLESNKDAELEEHFSALIPLIKPISGNMLIGGTVVEKDFYQENEWRYVPKKYSALFRDTFEQDRDKMNGEAEAQKITFAPSDVKYIFVKRDVEIPIIFDLIQNHLGQYPHNDIKILTTRIVSLETLACDI